MKMLAIKGHKKRGKEVIALLEMLGAINSHNLYGDENYAYYTIDGYKEIKGGIYVFGDEQLCYFTLEEFLEKFPYKVGDKVNSPCKGCIKTITSMKWDTYLNTVTYKLDNRIYTNIDQLKVVNDLPSYKEEIMDKANKAVYDANAQCCDIMNEIIKKDMEEVKIDIPKGYEFVGIDDDNQQVVFTKIQPQYPKTYEECCEVLLLKPERATYSVSGLEYKRHLIVNQQRLIICRDAYWKLAGDWKPDWKNDSQFKNIITCVSDNISNGTYATKNCILAFPTQEMRDTFYDNFKEEIEFCKELL